MLGIIQELKNTEKKAAHMIEDAGKKATADLAKAEAAGKDAFEVLRSKLDKEKLDQLAVAQKEVDAEVATIEKQGTKDLESLKKAATSKKSKIVGAVQKAILQ
tara:strand:- start:1030 stop:1338 length:309 start_codon:yes stop_codon:yes gene_type:complete